MLQSLTQKRKALFDVGATGFEPATPATPLQCATGLRHAPINVYVNILKLIPVPVLL